MLWLLWAEIPEPNPIYELNKEKGYHTSLLTAPDSLYYKNTLVFAFWNSPGLRHLLDLISPSSVLFKALYVPDIFSLHRAF